MNLAKAAEISDPRSIPGFNAALLPLCDGGELPAVDTTNGPERRMLEFAGIYYRLNCAIRALQESAVAEEQKQPLYVEISRLSSIRDQLEDRYAPEGFLAEPIMTGAYYADIRFLWAGETGGAVPRVQNHGERRN